jgi:type VI secretion system secreted protein VgrG
MKAVIGAAATLRSGRTNDAPVVLAGGIVAAFELVNAVEERSAFRAVLVPKVWHLAQSLHSRVFTNQSVPAILESVLDSRGFSRRDDYRLELTGKFPDREFVCQYKESDFAFMSRWMERV